MKGWYPILLVTFMGTMSANILYYIIMQSVTHLEVPGIVQPHLLQPH